MNCNNTLTFLKEWERMCKHSDCDTCKVLELADLCYCDDAVCKYIAFTQKDKFIAMFKGGATRTQFLEQICFSKYLPR